MVRNNIHDPSPTRIPALTLGNHSREPRFTHATHWYLSPLPISLPQTPLTQHSRLGLNRLPQELHRRPLLRPLQNPAGHNNDRRAPLPHNAHALSTPHPVPRTRNRIRDLLFHRTWLLVQHRKVQQHPREKQGEY